MYRIAKNEWIWNDLDDNILLVMRCHSKLGISNIFFVLLISFGYINKYVNLIYIYSLAKVSYLILHTYNNNTQTEKGKRLRDNHPHIFTSYFFNGAGEAK